jgi:integrase
MAVPPRFSAFIAVTTFASLRWGEVTALHRRDVDLSAGVVTVRAAYVERSTGALELGPPKSRASMRSVALPQPVVAMHAAHLDAYVDADPDALVFTGPSGRPLRRSNFNKAVEWRQIVTDLGVPRLHLHDLRRTGNTLAAGTPGTSTRDLMERMGHDTMRAALIYQHTTRDADRRIANALTERFNGPADANSDATVTPLSARGVHDPRSARPRRLGLTPRRPVVRGLQLGAGDGNRTRTVSLGS